MTESELRRPLLPLVCLALAAVLATGCTSMQPADLPPESLHSLIRAGSLAQPGDRVIVVVADGREHAFTVSSVDADAVRGELAGGGRITVAIDDIVALRTREPDPARTALAAGGVYVLLAVGVAAYVFLDFIY